jgi:hypothetical protein
MLGIPQNISSSRRNLKPLILGALPEPHKSSVADYLRFFFPLNQAFDVLPKPKLDEFT